MAKPVYKPAKKGGFPFGLKTKGKMPAKAAAGKKMAPPFMKKK